MGTSREFMNSRKIYSSDLKSRVVLEILREELTVSQISSKYMESISQYSTNGEIRHLKDFLGFLPIRGRKVLPILKRITSIEDLYCQVGKLSLQLL